jgi:hypothetical protein
MYTHTHTHTHISFQTVIVVCKPTREESITHAVVYGMAGTVPFNNATATHKR